MANLKKYEVVKPILCSFEGVLDEKGEELNGELRDMVIQLDPDDSATVKWLDKKCIKAKSGIVGKTTAKPANYGKPKGTGKK